MTTCIAAVKIAQKKKGLTDSEYRNLLSDMFQVKSCKALNDRQRAEFIDRILHSSTASTSTPMERKIWALWYDLKGALPERQQNLFYLIGICRRAAGVCREVKKISELGPEEMFKSIEALKRRVNEVAPIPF